MAMSQQETSNCVEGIYKTYRCISYVHDFSTVSPSHYFFRTREGATGDAWGSNCTAFFYIYKARIAVSFNYASTVNVFVCVYFV